MELKALEKMEDGVAQLLGSAWALFLHSTFLEAAHFPERINALTSGGEKPSWPTMQTASGLFDGQECSRRDGEGRWGFSSGIQLV